MEHIWLKDTCTVDTAGIRLVQQADLALLFHGHLHTQRTRCERRDKHVSRRALVQRQARSKHAWSRQQVLHHETKRPNTSIARGVNHKSEHQEHQQQDTDKPNMGIARPLGDPEVTNAQSCQTPAARVWQGSTCTGGWPSSCSPLRLVSSCRQQADECLALVSRGSARFSAVMRKGKL